MTSLVGQTVVHLFAKKNIDVVLTRKKDIYLSLDERTHIANTCNKADLFISIHANGSQKQDACGIETFFLDHQLLKKALIVSQALHKSDRLKGINTLLDVSQDRASDSSIFKKVLKERSDQSKMLAHLLQENMLAQVRKKNKSVVDRKVKSAVTQVLLGVTIPAALIEVGFLTNKYEAALLNTEEYRFLLADGIVSAVCSYLKSIKSF